MLPDTYSVTDLIGRIYDCSVEPARWSAVLEEICDEMDGLCAEVQSYNAVTLQLNRDYHFGWTEEILELARRHLRMCPVAPLALVAPVEEPFWAERDYGFEAMQKSNYYQLALSHAGHRDYIYTPLFRNTDEMAGWRVSRHISNGAFSEDHVAFIRLLTPHVKRAFSIGNLFIEREAASAGFHGILASLSCAAFVIDKGKSIVFRNAIAEAELATGTLLHEENSRLALRLTNVVKSLSDFVESDESRGLDLEFKDQEGARRHLTSIALPKLFGEKDLFLVLIRTPAAELHTPLGTASKMFNLTLAESQILSALLQGDTLENASGRFGISRSTVKTHLESIFSKSGVNRQADLIRRVMELKTPFG